MPTFHCIHCGQRIDAPESMSGKNADCPTCQSAITVPSFYVDQSTDSVLHEKTPKKDLSIVEKYRRPARFLDSIMVLVAFFGKKSIRLCAWIWVFFTIKIGSLFFPDRKRQNVMSGIIIFLLACIAFSCVYQARKTWAREDARERALARVQMRAIEEMREIQRNRAKREEIAENDQDLIDAGFTKAQIQENQRNARVLDVPWTEFKKSLLRTQHYLRFPDERVKDMERSRNQEIQRSRERAGLE